MFTEKQFMVIKTAVNSTKNQSEMAPYNKIMKDERYRSEFSDGELNVLLYISEECRRQHSGTRSVYQMALAWHYADTFPYEGIVARDFLDFILEVGKAVEPILNWNGYRRIGVGIMTNGVWNEKVPWSSIERLMNLLVVSWCEGDYGDDKGYRNHPKAADKYDQFYYDYEEIHPFLDGNGRSGKIIYNWLKGTLNNPVLPPLFWEGSIP